MLFIVLRNNDVSFVGLLTKKKKSKIDRTIENSYVDGVRRNTMFDEKSL